jgi:flavin reductase ActVB
VTGDGREACQHGGWSTTLAGDFCAADFRDAMSKLATGVVMVTADVDGRPWCLTVSACCSVSESPPTILVSLGARTVSAEAIQRSRRFGVSILGDALQEAAQFGSARGAPKFGEAICLRHESSVSPVVEGALAHFDCEVRRAIPVCDHVLLVGRARSVLVSRHDHPLLYYSRSYRTLEPSWRAERLENMV